MTGVTPSGSGHSAEPEPSSAVSAVPASVPNAAHTPGPWQSKHDYTKEGACTIIANVDGEIHPDGTTSHTYDFICTCEDEFGEYTERALANARLIAAAPELYDILNDIIWNGALRSDQHERLAKANAVLAKVRGR